MSNKPASASVGTNIARELELRFSAGKRFAAGASRGQAPASAMAYGRALRENPSDRSDDFGAGSRSRMRTAVTFDSRRSSAAAKAMALSTLTSNSAENTGLVELSPYTSISPV